LGTPSLPRQQIACAAICATLGAESAPGSCRRPTAAALNEEAREELRTEKELQEAAPEVAYEFSMLVGTFAAMNGTEPKGPISELLRNACIESFLTHVRNLKDFFGPNQPRRTNLWAGEYVLGWGELVDRKVWELLEAEEGRINVRLSHLSGDRRKHDPGWDLGLMLQRLAELALAFKESLPAKWHGAFENLRVERKWDSVNDEPPAAK
jgi:hypothetical protein